MKSYYIYKHTSPDGKVYIGATSQRPAKRWGGGSGYVSNPYFAQDIRKYGWEAFTHEILASGLTKAEAGAEEARFIREHHSAERPFGYNIDLGGYSAGRVSAETRAKMSASHKGHPTSAETRAKLSASHKGKPLTPAQLAGVRAQGLRRRGVSLPEATRAKISAALSGRKRSAEHCRRISESKMGHTVSEATRRKISETKRAAATTARGAPECQGSRCCMHGDGRAVRHGSRSGPFNRAVSREPVKLLSRAAEDLRRLPLEI